MNNLSFCQNCGDYVKPESGQVYFNDEGRPGVLCDNCINAKTLSGDEQSRFSGYCQTLQAVISCKGG